MPAVIELTQDGAHAVVLPEDGGRLASFRVDDLELLRTPQDDPGGTHWGSFVMAPWAGRTRNGRFTFDGLDQSLIRNAGSHAIHGTVRDQVWTPEWVEPNSAHLVCDFGTRWPYPGHAEQTITLRDDRIELELSLHADVVPMPALGGWHPWWRRRLARGDAVTIDLPAGSMLRRDADGIPTAERVSPIPAGPWDDCFTDLNGPVRLHWAHALSLTIESDCAFVVVYDEPADAVCVEPQSGPPDALNHDPPVAVPGHPVVVHSSWRWHRLP